MPDPRPDSYSNPHPDAKQKPGAEQNLDSEAAPSGGQPSPPPSIPTQDPAHVAVTSPLGVYRLLRPLLFSMDPEFAHRLALHGLGAAEKIPGGMAIIRALLGAGASVDPSLRTTLWGRDFPHPLGLAAGLDKDGVALSSLLSLGFAFVEAGTVTPRPQPGNPRPRLFRLPEDYALINRMGFNNEGAASLAHRLARLRARHSGAMVGVNLGKNKDTPLEEAADDYLAAYRRVAPFADFITVNVSSPNTPGLRDLQAREALEPIIAAVSRERARDVAAGATRVPLLVKVAPDLDEAGLAAVVDVARDHDCDGLIAVNTTLARPGLSGGHQGEAGGLSGRPLQKRAVEVVSSLYRNGKGQLPVIGVGGVFGPEQAYALIRAGATLVQAYTGFIYRGPGLVRHVTEGLAGLLKRDGFTSVSEAVGVDHRSGREEVGKG